VVVALGLGATGVMTAVAVAGIGGSSTASPESALTRTIARQRVAAAQPATSPPPAASAQPNQAITREGMLAEVDRHEGELNTIVDRITALRKQAYDAKDLIRTSFISTKLDEIKLLQSKIQPVIDSIRQPGLEMFVMQGKLQTIRTGLEQARKAAAEAEAATGDTTDPTGFIFDATGSTRDTDTSVTEPQGPPNPAADGTLDRPPNASPYR
jgi:hypothetical protein